MTRNQTYRLAQAVKAIAGATNTLFELMQETLTDPSTSLAIGEPTAKIATANEQLLQVTKQHSKQFIEPA